MSQAIRCDCCGKLVPYGQHVRFGTVFLPAAEDNIMHSWSEIDICLDCLKRPAYEVLTEACDGLVKDLEELTTKDDGGQS